MHRYLIYAIAPGDGCRTPLAGFEAPDDGTALAITGMDESFMVVELWCGERLVQTIGPMA